MLDYNKFIKDFFEDHRFLFEEDNIYMKEKLIKDYNLSNSQQVAVLHKRIKNALKKYVDTNEMTKEQFRNTLSVMVKNNIFFTYKNFEKTARAIDIGLYDEDLKIIRERVEIRKVDWGSENIWNF